MTRRRVGSLVEVTVVLAAMAIALVCGSVYGANEPPYYSYVRHVAPKWPLVQFGQTRGKCTWKQYTLKPGQTGYGGFRLKTPPGPPRDLFWAFAWPADTAFQSWYIISKDPRVPLNGFRQFWDYRNAGFEGVQLPAKNVAFLQALVNTGTMLRPNTDYIFPMTFRSTALPQKVWVAVNLLPHSELGDSEESIRKALGLVPTTIETACEMGLADQVSKILAADPAAINTVNQKGMQPIHVAASSGHPDVVRLLIERGADVNARDRAGNTPL